MKYQPLGNLFLEFPDHTNAVDYFRRLNLDTAVADVSYRVGEVTCHREDFSSPADQGIVIRVTADRPGAVSFSARLSGIANTNPPGDEKFSTKFCRQG